jgi:hypothetical protein
MTIRKMWDTSFHKVGPRFRPVVERHSMKKIDVEKDYKRTRFLIVAMVVQIVVVVLLLAAYTMWLRW